MRDHDEFCAEISRRKEKLIHKKRQRKKMLYGAVPVAMCLLVLAVIPWSRLDGILFGGVIDPSVESGMTEGADREDTGEMPEGTGSPDINIEQAPTEWIGGVETESECAKYTVMIATPQNRDLIYLTDLYALFEMLGQTEGVKLISGDHPAYPEGTGAITGSAQGTGATEEMTPPGATMQPDAETEKRDPIETGDQVIRPLVTGAPKPELEVTEAPEWVTDAPETENMFKPDVGVHPELIVPPTTENVEEITDESVNLEYAIVVQTSSGEIFIYSFSPELYETLIERICELD